MPGQTGNPLVDPILDAAANADAVRCAQVMTVAYVANGQTSFTRAQQVTLWGQQFPQDKQGTGQQQIALRQRRAESLLSGTLAVIRDGVTSMIGDTEILAWLGARDLIVAGLPQGYPIPVNPDDIQAVIDMVENRS